MGEDWDILPHRKKRRREREEEDQPADRILSWIKYLGDAARESGFLWLPPPPLLPNLPPAPQQRERRVVDQLPEVREKESETPRERKVLIACRSCGTLNPLDPEVIYCSKCGHKLQKSGDSGGKIF